MKASADFHTLPNWVILLIVVIYVVVKLPLLTLNGGEYTDGIIQLTLWESPVVFFPPGYTLCVNAVNLLVNDLLLSGRLVSMLASAATLLVFYALARLLLNDDRSALLAVVFLALSPVFNRWSIRVMTDALFLFLFVQCLFLFCRAWLQPARSLWPLLLCTGLAALVRYQGLYFLPWLVLLLWMRRDQSFRLRTLAGWIVALLPWMALIAWLAVRGFGHTEQFVQRASFGLGTTALLYFNMFETFLMYWPWAITHSLFVLGVIGWVIMARRQSDTRLFSLFALLTALVILVVQSAFLSFQYRYLLPLLPLWCIAAAAGTRGCMARIRWQPVRIAIVVVVLLNLLLVSSAVLALQRGSFADLAAGASYFQSRWTNARLLCDEVYREGVYAPKAGFFSRRDVLLYYPGREDLQEGDILLITNVYSDMEQVKQSLEERFTLQVLGRWQSYSVPLLPDIMVTPRVPPMTSNPPAMGLRFTPQYYMTVALRIMPK